MLTDYEQGLMELLDADVEGIEVLVRERVGIQRYARLKVIVTIVHSFVLEPGFSRSDARTVCAQANSKAVDRALADMESAGMIDVMAANDQRQRGGAVYRVCPAVDWQRRDPAVAAQRALRSGRGGRRQAV